MVRMIDMLQPGITHRTRDTGSTGLPPEQVCPCVCQEPMHLLTFDAPASFFCYRRAVWVETSGAGQSTLASRNDVFDCWLTAGGYLMHERNWFFSKLYFCRSKPSLKTTGQRFNFVVCLRSFAALPRKFLDTTCVQASTASELSTVSHRQDSRRPVQGFCSWAIA